MCWFRLDKALITSLSVESDLLKLWASLSSLPEERDFLFLSEPARSTKLSYTLKKRHYEHNFTWNTKPCLKWMQTNVHEQIFIHLFWKTLIYISSSNWLKLKVGTFNENWKYDMRSWTFCIHLTSSYMSLFLAALNDVLHFIICWNW